MSVTEDWAVQCVQDELVALRAENERLKEALKWVGQVHPDNSAYESSRINIGDGHSIHMTWREWNALREALGLRPQKPIRRSPR